VYTRLSGPISRVYRLNVPGVSIAARSRSTKRGTRKDVADLSNAKYKNPENIRSRDFRWLDVQICYA